MRTANIGTLKNQLSFYIKFVRNGGEVVVCDRNVPVARILPFHPHGSFESEEAGLIVAGKMAPPRNAAPMDWESFWALPRPGVSDDVVSEAIEWAKGDR